MDALDMYVCVCVKLLNIFLEKHSICNFKELLPELFCLKGVNSCSKSVKKFRHMHFLELYSGLKKKLRNSAHSI